MEILGNGNHEKWKFRKMGVLGNGNFGLKILANRNYRKWKFWGISILGNGNYGKWKFFEMVFWEMEISG